MVKLILLFLFFSFTSLAFADTVYLKSGKVVEGVISEETDRYISIKVAGKVALRYYRDEIKKIEKTFEGKPVFELKASPLIIEKDNQAEEVKTDFVEDLKESGQGTVIEKEQVEQKLKAYFSLLKEISSGEVSDQALVRAEEMIDFSRMQAYQFYLKIVGESKPGYEQQAKKEFLLSLFQGLKEKYFSGGLLSLDKIAVDSVYIFSDAPEATAWISVFEKSFSIRLNKDSGQWLIQSVNY